MKGLAPTHFKKSLKTNPLEQIPDESGNLLQILALER